MITDILAEPLCEERFVEINTLLGLRDVDRSGLTLRNNVGHQCPTIPNMKILTSFFYFVLGRIYTVYKRKDNVRKDVSRIE